MKTQLTSSIVLDLEALAVKAQEIVGVDKLVAYANYEELRDQAKRLLKIANVYETDAIWISALIRENFDALKSMSVVKEALTLAFASNDEQRVHDEIRASIEEAIVEADPRLLEAANDRPDKTIGVVKYFMESAQEAKREADYLFHTADKLMKDHGLQSIVDAKSKAKKAFNKK